MIVRTAANDIKESMFWHRNLRGSNPGLLAPEASAPTTRLQCFHFIVDIKKTRLSSLDREFLYITHNNREAFAQIIQCVSETQVF